MSSFVIFGNLERPFTRMSNAVREAFPVFPGPISIQAGINLSSFSDHPDGANIFHTCSFADFSQQIRNASVVITHGGVGAVKEAILAGLHPGVFVRQASKGEHIDDHQVDWCNLLFTANIATELKDTSDLKQFLAKGEFQQRDMGIALEFFDDTKLKEAIQGFIRQVVASKRAHQTRK